MTLTYKELFKFIWICHYFCLNHFHNIFELPMIKISIISITSLTSPEWPGNPHEKQDFVSSSWVQYLFSTFWLYSIGWLYSQNTFSIS